MIYFILLYDKGFGRISSGVLWCVVDHSGTGLQ